MTPAWSPRPLEELLGGKAAGLLFTDVDGTLIDFETYRCPPAVREAIARLREAGIGTVAVTSKTAGEMAGIRGRTGILPLVVTEGGGVLMDLETGERLLPGGGREPLARFVAELADAGWPVRGLSTMEAGELARLTGLPPDSARFALEREASEPFLFTDGTAEERKDAVIQVATEAGYRVVRGGRLYHLLGNGVDKGAAIRRLLRDVPGAGGLTTGAVGDAWNDLAMVCSVDVGFLLGVRVPEEDVPCRVFRIPVDGPEGFVEAARRFLSNVAPSTGLSASGD